MKRGWWKLTWTPIDDIEELSEATLEHIGDSIKQGYTQGEILEEEEEEDYIDDSPSLY